MSDSEFVIITEPAPEQVQYLEDRLYEFNSGATGITGGDDSSVLPDLGGSHTTYRDVPLPPRTHGDVIVEQAVTSLGVEHPPWPYHPGALLDALCR